MSACSQMILFSFNKHSSCKANHLQLFFRRARRVTSASWKLTYFYAAVAVTSLENLAIPSWKNMFKVVKAFHK